MRESQTVQTEVPVTMCSAQGMPAASTCGGGRGLRRCSVGSLAVANGSRAALRGGSPAGMDAQAGAARFAEAPLRWARGATPPIKLATTPHRRCACSTSRCSGCRSARAPSSGCTGAPSPPSWSAAACCAHAPRRSAGVSARRYSMHSRFAYEAEHGTSQESAAGAMDLAARCVDSGWRRRHFGMQRYQLDYAREESAGGRQTPTGAFEKPGTTPPHACSLACMAGCYQRPKNSYPWPRKPHASCRRLGQEAPACAWS